MDAVNARRIVIVAGHRIRSTRSGPEALRWLEDEPCDLLIVDFSMPEMDGPALYRRVLARWPTRAPRALFVSGYGEQASASVRLEIGLQVKRVPHPP